MIQMTEQNNKLKKDNVRLTQNEGIKYRQQIEAKNEEIRTLKEKLFEQSNEQGLQMLNALKDSSPQRSEIVSQKTMMSTPETSGAKDSMNQSMVSSNEETKTAPSESTESMRNQIRELSEKLVFAHETITIMEEEHCKNKA